MSFLGAYHHDTYPAISATQPSLSAEGQVVLVTGAGSGIGKAAAKSFVTAGAKAVAIVGRTEPKLKTAAAELSNGKTAIEYYVADIVDAEATGKAFAAFTEKYGKVNVVVANAGYADGPLLIKEETPEQLWNVIDINAKGTIITAREFLKHAAPGASLVNISSAAAHIPAMPRLSSYSVGKLASARYLECLQAEYPELRVFNIQPGAVDSTLNKKYDAFPATDAPELPADFSVWLANGKTDFLKGRFLWANWDVNELQKHEKEIVEKNLFIINIEGFSSIQGKGLKHNDDQEA